MICDKAPYDTYKEAQSATSKISVREKQGFRTYKCNECKKFHLTSIKKKTLKNTQVSRRVTEVFIPITISKKVAKHKQKSNPRATYTIADAIKFKNNLNK